MQVYEKLIQQQIGVAPSPLFNVLPSHQHYIRMNCSFEWSEQIKYSLELFIQTIQHSMSDE